TLASIIPRCASDFVGISRPAYMSARRTFSVPRNRDEPTSRSPHINFHLDEAYMRWKCIFLAISQYLDGVFFTRLTCVNEHRIDTQNMASMGHLDTAALHQLHVLDRKSTRLNSSH